MSACYATAEAPKRDRQKEREWEQSLLCDNVATLKVLVRALGSELARKNLELAIEEVESGDHMRSMCSIGRLKRE